MYESLIISLAAIVVLSLCCQWIAWWLKLPAILFLLLTGIVVGPVLGWLRPATIFGNLLTPLIELSVAVILFEGSLSLNFKEIKGHMHIVSNLLTVGILITSIFATFFAHILFKLPYETAILFAVIICVSGPTVIVPLLRAVRPPENIANILRWEGVVIDPVGVLLAVLVFNFIVVYHAHGTFSHAFAFFCLRIGISAMLGMGIGYFCGLILRRDWLPEYLQNVGVLAFVILAFTLGNFFEEGSGLLTVTLMGILLANIPDTHIEDILDFKESLSILLISAVFIILAAQITFSHLYDVLGSALIFLAILQFVVRPLSVFICTIKSSLNWREKTLLAWIAPRGIVAAAISAIFAVRLQGMNIAGSQQLVLLTFIVIVGTVVFQSVTTKPLAKLLKLSTDNARGFLIVGANKVARSIAKELKTQGFRVQLTTGTWDYAQAARMEGLPVFLGSPVSEYAQRHLDLVGLDGLLAITANSNLNGLSAIRFKREFPAKNVYTIQTDVNENEKTDKRTAMQRFKGQSLFENDVTFATLNQFLEQGGEIKSTPLTEVFTFKNYKEKNQESIPLFAIDPKKRVHFFTSNKEIEPGNEWMIVSLAIKARNPE